MNIKRTLTLGAAAVTLLALTSCAKQKNLNRLEGDWKLVGGPNFDPDVDIFLDFEEDGDFTFTTLYSYYGSTVRNIGTGDWEWDGDLESDLEVDFAVSNGYYSYDQNIDFEVKLLEEDDMELLDDDGNLNILERD